MLLAMQVDQRRQWERLTEITTEQKQSLRLHYAIFQ